MNRCMRRVFLVLLTSLLAGSQQPQEGQTSKFSAGLQFASSLTWSSKESFLLVADRPAGQLRRIDAKGVSTWKEGLPAAGIALDDRNSVYLTDTRERRLVRLDARGKQEVLVASFEGKKLNGPGDVVVAKNGHVWFADPAFGTADAHRELSFYGIYHVSPKGTLTAVARLPSRPNGLAFSPDGKTLYASVADDRTVLAWTIGKNGETADQRVFIRQTDGVPAGLTTSPDGRVWVCAREVEVYSAAGEKLHSIPVPERPVDCEFGEGGKSLFIAAGTSVYRWHATNEAAKEAAPHRQQP